MLASVKKRKKKEKIVSGEYENWCRQYIPNRYVISHPLCETAYRRWCKTSNTHTHTHRQPVSSLLLASIPSSFFFTMLRLLQCCIAAAHFRPSPSPAAGRLFEPHLTHPHMLWTPTHTRQWDIHTAHRVRRRRRRRKKVEKHFKSFFFLFSFRPR